MSLFAKRSFDLIVGTVCLIVFSWVIVFGWVLAALSTRSNGFFYQTRVGRGGELFKIIKLKTMRPDHSGLRSTITAESNVHITKTGKILRRFKIDELPQLINVVIGHMSIVGPRPDVVGYADKLIGEDRLILNLRPGITGPASLKYKNEEEVLSKVADPRKYNDEVIWPDKVKINLDYYKGRTMTGDIIIIFKTIF